MNKMQYSIILILAMLSGIIGGMLASRFIPISTLYAKRFEVQDKRGNTRMVLDKSSLVFFPQHDSQASIIIDAEQASLSLYGFNAGDRVAVESAIPRLRLSDAQGNVLWEISPPRIE